MSMSQEMGLMELTPRGSRDLHHQHNDNHHHFHKKNHVAPTHEDKKKQSYPQPDHGMGHLVLEAARRGSPTELEGLLRDGANPNVVDAEGKSPLHLVLATGCSCTDCVRDAEACLILLLSSNRVNVNLQEEVGQNTALHLAIDSQLSKCAQMLISYGADVSLRNDMAESVVQLMAKKMPHCLLHLLNESIYVDQYDPHHERCLVKLDLSPLIGHSFPPVPQPKMENKKSPKPKKTKKSEGEMTLLMDLLENGRFSREPLFTHPLVQVLLHLKWKRVRGVFWASLVCYLLWVIMYTSYVLQVYVFSCPCQLYKRAASGSSSNPSNDQQSDFDGETITLSRCEIETGFSFKVILIILSTFLLLLIELGRFIVTPKIYIRGWLNLGHFVLICCVFATTIPNLQSQTAISALQYQVAAFTVFLAWVFVLSHLGRLPSLSKYVEIFGHVVKAFGSFILTFASLFMGFSLAFCILFFGDETSPFANFFHSLVKVFVMMVGEMDYQSMFYPDGDNKMGQEHGPVMGHLLYASFVILVCIILINLFMGLTVSDIQMLERKAEFSRTCRLILEVFHLESAFLSKRLPKCLRKFLKQTFLLNGPSHSFRPNDTKDKSLPSNLSRETLQLAEASFRKARSQRCYRSRPDIDQELVEIQTYFPTMEKTEHEHNGTPHHSRSTTSSSPSSQNSSPLETNSLDLNVHHPAHSRAPYTRPWASCVDHTDRNYHPA